MHIRSILRAVCLAVLVTLTAAACGDGGTGPEEASALRGTWAGEAWDGEAFAYLEDGTLWISSAPNWMNGPYVSVAARDFHGPGTYALGPGSAAIRYIVGGDGIWASYESAQPAAGTLVVTDYTGGHVTGRVEFVADVQRGEAPAGARARFEGEFRARRQLPRLPSR